MALPPPGKVSLAGSLLGSEIFRRALVAINISLLWSENEFNWWISNQFANERIQMEMIRSSQLRNNSPTVIGSGTNPCGRCLNRGSDFSRREG